MYNQLTAAWLYTRYIDFFFLIYSGDATDTFFSNFQNIWKLQIKLCITSQSLNNINNA